MVGVAGKVQQLSDPGSKTPRRRLAWRRVSEHLDRWIRGLACLAGVASSEIDVVRCETSLIGNLATSKTPPDLSAQLEEILVCVWREERMWRLENRIDGSSFGHKLGEPPRPK